MRIKNKRGFTLTELIIVMAIFITVIMITATAFKTIVNSSSQQSKSVETQIEGIVGLEVMRADLQQAGFGLPWAFSTPITYEEADSTAVTSDALFFNDEPSDAPRAILSGTTDFNSGSKYIVIKSTLAAANSASKKWTTISYDKDNLKTFRLWGDAERDFVADDQVIVVKNDLMTTPPTRELMVPSSTIFSATFDSYSSQDLTSPHYNGDTFEIYGINPDPATDLRMPFNRADYYIKRPTTNVPASCADNTGILYKSTINHSDGKPSIGMPLLDCVADMQIVYGLSEAGSNIVNQHSDDVSLLSAAEIRSQLREIRVYILAQEGKRDRSYTYPSETIQVGEQINGIDVGRLFNLKDLLGADYKYYRWKVYTIVVRPKNLIQ